MDLKDIKLNDLIKLAVAVTATLLITMNFAISVNNSTVINNYIAQSEKNFNETKSNLTSINTDIKKSLSLNQKILKEVD